MAKGPPPLSRQQLARILGIDPGAPAEEVLRVSSHLLTRLERRRQLADPVGREALNREVDALTRSLLAWIGSLEVSGRRPTSATNAAVSSSIAREKLLIAMIVVLGLLVVMLFSAWLSRDGAGADSDPRTTLEPARLIVESRPKNAELRVRLPESEELVRRVTGDGVSIELLPGHYEIEVSREDCPDTWIREIDLETAETRRYEPTICAGAGEVVVRSNVSGDRLRIDGIDLGATRPEPHLLGVGDHRIRVEKKGYLPFEGRVRIGPDQRVELMAELVEAPAGPSGASAGGEEATPSQSAALPFEKGVPSAPPRQSGALERARRGQPRQGSRAARPFQPEALLPEPIVVDPLALAKPKLDFDSESRLGSLGKGGSTSWHDRVSGQFLARFDADGSGRIDRDSETQSIPCSFWLETERSFDEGGLGLSMSRLYGFDGSEWHPKALGFAREQRTLGYERMRSCGLAP